MGVPRFFKVPKHNKFNYQPLYYDERKEEMKKRKKRLGIDTEKDETKKVTEIKFASNMNYREVSDMKRASTIRLYAIVGILIFVSYYVISHFELIQKMFSVFYKKNTEPIIDFISFF